MYENLIKRHSNIGVSEKDIKQAVEQLAPYFGKVCNTKGRIALVDLITSGDVPVERPLYE